MAELAFTGKDITAARAKEIGLVNDVFARRRRRRGGGAASWRPRSPPTRLWPCRGRRRCSPPCEDRSVAEGLDYVATWNAGFLASDDLVEAMTAFMEKRPPEFKGR